MRPFKTGACVAPALLAFALTAAPASAHAWLVESYPANKQQVLKPLHTIRLVFSGKADANFSSVKLKDSKGAIVAEATQKEPSKELTLPTPSLMPGDYRIVFRVLCADGDIVEGKLEFSIHGLEA
jgi:methionine-rich copper-binding protein CopC